MTENSKTATKTTPKTPTDSKTPRHVEFEEHVDHARASIKEAVDKAMDKLPGRDHDKK